MLVGLPGRTTPDPLLGHGLDPRLTTPKKRTTAAAPSKTPAISGHNRTRLATTAEAMSATGRTKSPMEAAATAEKVSTAPRVPRRPEQATPTSARHPIHRTKDSTRLSYIRMTDTRQRLLQATRECLGRRGLAATTSRDIAATAGANLAAITYYFGSKDDLVAAVLLEGLREWLAPAIEVLGCEGEPAERTVAAIQTLTVTFDAHRADAPLYLEALVQSTRMESLQRDLLQLWDELRQLLAAQMTEMQSAGSLPRWVEPRAMASLFIAVANGLVMQVTLDASGPELGAMAGQFAGLLLTSRE